MSHVTDHIKTPEPRARLDGLPVGQPIETRFLLSANLGDAMPDYLPLGEAAAAIGISARTLRERVRAGELAIYSNPKDRRTRLVRSADLDRYVEPKPLTDRVNGGGLIERGKAA